MDPVETLKQLSQARGEAAREDLVDAMTGWVARGGFKPSTADLEARGVPALAIIHYRRQRWLAD